MPPSAQIRVAAVCSPMPCAAPVTTTILPSNRPRRDELRQHAGAALVHRPAHRLLRPIGVLAMISRPRRVAVTGLERRDDVEMVLCAQRITPRRVAQHLAHPALDAERLYACSRCSLPVRVNR